MSVRIIYGAGLLVMIYLNIMYQWEAGRTLLGAMLVLPLLCEGLTWLMAAGFRAELVSASKTFQEGETGRVWISLKSRPAVLTAALGRIRAEVEVTDSYQRRKREWIWLSGEKTEVDSLDGRLMEPGFLTMRLRRLRIEDPTGLGRGYRRNLSQLSVVVLPEVVIPKMEFSEQVRGFLIDSDIFSRTESGDDVSEVFGLREYRPGDSLQRIHWKMSARQEKLWVKEYSLPIGAAVVLAAENQRGKELSGNFLRGFASLAAGFLEYACPCYVSWSMEKPGQTKRFLLSGPGDYDEMIRTFLEDSRKGIGRWDEEAYREIFPERYGRRLVFTEEGNLFVDGEKVLTVAMEKDFRKQFQEALIEV